MIDGCHARNPTAERVSDNDRRTTTFVPNDGRRVAREIMQRLIFHRPYAAARAARLRSQNAKAGSGYSRRDRIEILRCATARGQENDQRPAAFGDDFDAHIIVGNYFPCALSPHRCSAQ
jgi:hypothetical protein